MQHKKGFANAILWKKGFLHNVQKTVYNSRFAVVILTEKKEQVGSNKVKVATWFISKKGKEKLLNEQFSFMYAYVYTLYRLTNSWYGLRSALRASSVMITFPPSIPTPPHVPMRKKIGSLTLAWYINLIISWRRILTEGMPIPCWNTYYCRGIIRKMNKRVYTKKCHVRGKTFCFLFF